MESGEQRTSNGEQGTENRGRRTRKGEQKTENEKHAQKVVRFRCKRSNGNARKRHETGNGNTGYPSCFRNGLTCFCHVSVYGFLQFRPVGE